MTTADVAVLLAAAAIAAVALTAAALSRRQTRLRAEALWRLLTIADDRLDHVITDAATAAKESAEALADLDAQLTRITDEKHDAEADFKAQLARLSAESAAALAESERRAGKAVAAGMGILANERAEFLESLQAWQYLTFAALQLPGPRALPAAPSPPELLPSGHALIAGDPDVLIHPDDLDVMSLPLPRRNK